ncbi:MAG: hypothetical protein WCK15_23790, partial [Pirellula sp.]
TTDFQVRPWGIRRTRKSVVPLNQQAGKRGIALGTSLTHRVVKLPPKTGPSNNSKPIRESSVCHSRNFCGYAVNLS